MESALRPSPNQESSMTLRAFALRFTLSATLVLVASFGGGWKWESFLSHF
jgi:hypothetical protein